MQDGFVRSHLILRFLHCQHDPVSINTQTYTHWIWQRLPSEIRLRFVAIIHGNNRPPRSRARISQHVSSIEKKGKNMGMLDCKCKTIRRMMMSSSRRITKVEKIHAKFMREKRDFSQKKLKCSSKVKTSTHNTEFAHTTKLNSRLEDMPKLQ